MVLPHDDLRRHLADHHGVISTDRLNELGVSRWKLDRWLRRGLFETTHTGVVRITTTPRSFEGDCLAACLADDELVIGGPSAARLWGFKHTGLQELVVAVVSHDRTPVCSGVTLRRSNILEPCDIVQRRDGIRLTSPPRTWFDRARDMTDQWFEALTEHVIDRHCQVPTLWAMGRRMMANGRPGSARVRRVMSSRADWQKPADSTLEHDVLRALERRGIRLVRQYPIRLSNGIRIHLDGADPELKWGLEVDHVTWHGGRLEAQRDKRRDRKLRLSSWQIERVTDADWRADREGELADLIALYRARGGRPAA